jgi:hypothetical protein
VGGILGILEPRFPPFHRVREHPLVKGDGVRCWFSESPYVPDAIIDELAGDGSAYTAHKDDARELVRTAIRNFDTLHFQALLYDRFPAAYKKALRKSKPRLDKIALHARRCAEQLRHVSPGLPDLVILEEYAADPRTTLFGQEPTVEKAGRSGRCLAMPIRARRSPDKPSHAPRRISGFTRICPPETNEGRPLGDRPSTRVCRRRGTDCGPQRPRSSTQVFELNMTR